MAVVGLTAFSRRVVVGIAASFRNSHGRLLVGDAAPVELRIDPDPQGSRLMPRRETKVPGHIRQSIGISIKVRRGSSEGRLGRLQANHERWTKCNHPSTGPQVQDRGPFMQSCKSHAPHVYFSPSPSRLPSVRLTSNLAPMTAQATAQEPRGEAILSPPSRRSPRCSDQAPAGQSDSGPIISGRLENPAHATR
jgi:hypothetical protein